MKKLDININNEPPTVKLIAKARKEAKINEQEVLDKSKKENKKLLPIFIILLILPLLSSIFFSKFFDYLFLLLFFLFIVFGAMMSKAEEYDRKDREIIARKLDYLSTNTPGICINYEKLIKKHQELYQYQKKIAIMGRKPIIAEYDAFYSWDDETDERERKKSAEVAIENIGSYQ